MLGNLNLLILLFVIYLNFVILIRFHLLGILLHDLIVLLALKEEVVIKIITNLTFGKTDFNLIKNY